MCFYTCVFCGFYLLNVSGQNQKLESYLSWISDSQTLFLSPPVQTPHPSAERRGPEDPQSNPHQLHVPAADQDGWVWVRRDPSSDAPFKETKTKEKKRSFLIFITGVQVTYKDPQLHILWDFVTWFSTRNPNPLHVEHPSVGPLWVSITAEGSHSPVASWVPRNYGFRSFYGGGESAAWFSWNLALPAAFYSFLLNPSQPKCDYVLQMHAGESFAVFYWTRLLYRGYFLHGDPLWRQKPRIKNV